MKFMSCKIAAAAVALAAMAAALPATAVEISFYYPVAVSGPLTKIIDGTITARGPGLGLEWNETAVAKYLI